MRMLARAALTLTAVTTALSLCATTASATVYSSSDRWASYSTDGYSIGNNVWGNGFGSQTVWADGYSHWGVHATQPATNGVKSYPNVGRNVGTPLDSLSSATSTFAIDVPKVGVWNAAYDVWLNNTSVEVMAWVNRHGSINPLGAPTRTVTLDGNTWTLWVGHNGSVPAYSFVRSSNETSGTVNLYHLLKWLENTKHYFANPTLSTVQFGFEITTTDNSPQDFDVTHYSAGAA